MSPAFTEMSRETIDLLADIVGQTGIVTDHEKMIDYSHDEYSQHDIRNFPEAVVKPQNADQISRVVRLANERKVPLTPRGGGTGLCGGCVPTFGGVVMSFENMASSVEVDRDNMMAVADAGVPLTDFYEAVEGAGLFFPPHPGDENATIGGVIATNAGGARAVKYGVIRNFVRGIEVVLPSGEIIQIGGKTIKSSSGYSLLHLLIGSEGTLGIVTRATINLLPPPDTTYTLVVPYQNLSDAIKTVPEIMQHKILPMAVEFMDRDTIRISEDLLNKTWPCPGGKAHLMIIVDGSSEDEVMTLSESIGEVCLQNGADDVFVADDRAKQKNILEIRSQIYEAMRNHMVEILDISIPRASIAEFVQKTEDIAEQTGLWMPTYGHAGDGNVHTHLMKATWDNGSWTETPDWERKSKEARKRVHDLGREMAGQVSGEHGIGVIKREYMQSFLGRTQLDLMKSIKRVFDPNGIMNPGKVLA